MVSVSCREAEVAAGAIALGEATDVQRESYRRHVSTCPACLGANGGERQIERTMARVTQARDAETWEPDILRAVHQRIAARPRWYRTALAAAGGVVAIALSIHYYAATELAKIDPLVVHYDGSSLVVERSSTEQHARITAAAALRPKMVVEHNVIYLSRQPVPPAAKRVAAAVPAPVRKAPQPKRVAAAGAEDSSVPVWREGGSGTLSVVHENRTVTQPVAPPAAQEMTVAIAPSYATHDPAPIGGETAINPRPTEIAYAQGASGTTVFEVLIDEHGNPTKCNITKSSGFLSLDESVCKAAMTVHYTPQSANGKAEPGVYRDAFTFRDNGGGGD